MRSWFSRLFGGRTVTEEDDEPARAAPPASLKVARPVKRPSGTGKVKSGFDPYNSGSFERGNAWERVGRR